MELSNAHVVITGGSRGIGAAMAHSFVKAGATVSLVARSVDALEKLAAGLGGHSFPADLFNAEEVDNLIPRITEKAGAIDVLVNNAGIETNAFFHTVSAKQIRDITTINLEVPMVLTRAVLDGMLERNYGHLVFTSSLAGTGGFPGLTAYGATKAGLSNFVAGLRMELKDTNVHTTVVAPGPVDTQMWDKLEEVDDLGAMLKRLRRCQVIPKKSPEYIAEQTVSAVKADRRHFRSPRRLLVTGLMREAPSRITEALLAGVQLGPRLNK